MKNILYILLDTYFEMFLCANAAFFPVYVQAWGERDEEKEEGRNVLLKRQSRTDKEKERC